MTSASTNFHHPSLKLFACRSCRLQSLKPISSSLIFPSPKLGFCGGFVPKRAVLVKNRVMGPNSVVELIKLLPFRNPNDEEDEEGLGVLQRHDSADGPSELSLILNNGWESTLNRLSKWILAGLFAVVILCRHDAEAVWAAMGAVANSMLSVTLKKILNQERPVASLRSEPGMPSSHAQSIFYIVMFTIWSRFLFLLVNHIATSICSSSIVACAIAVVEWLGINEITVTVGAFALAFGTYLSWLRVSQQLHTLSQVIVGATFGTLFCFFWFWSWNAFVQKAFVSSLWVRIVVALGATGFCLGFVVHVIHHWFRDEH